MPPKPRLVLPALTEYVKNRIMPLTRQNVVNKTHYLVGLLDQCFFRKREHDAPASAREVVDAFSLESEEVRDHLGGKHTNPTTGYPLYQTYLEPFFEFDPTNAGYSKLKGETKKYFLRKNVLAELDRLWRDDASVADVVDAETGKPLPAGALPTSGVSSSYATVRVPSVLPFNPALLTLKIADLDKRLVASKVGERRSVLRQLRYLILAKKWVLSFGGIANTYADTVRGEDSTGRLYGQGELHPQSMHREVRRVLFGGRGLWDYDFVACHPTILQSLARHHGLTTPPLDNYLANRKAIHRELEEKLELPEGSKKVKEVMTALSYGASLVPHPSTALYGTLGRQGLAILKANPFIIDYLTDIKAVRGIILKHATPKGGFLVNVVGKKLALSEKLPTGKTRKVSSDRLLAHLVQGIEAWCLNLVCEGFSDILVLMFDGWISPKRPSVSALEARILTESQKQLGFPLTMRLKEEELL